jgi:hypothetical protein
MASAKLKAHSSTKHVLSHSGAGLDINICPIPVKTDVGQIDLVLRLSDVTNLVLPAISGPAFLQTSHYIINVIVEFALSTFRARNFITFLAWFFRGSVMRVKIMYWSSDRLLIFSEHFYSITDHIFHFKIWLWFSGLLNRKIDSDIKPKSHCELFSSLWLGYRYLFFFLFIFFTNY